MRRNIRMGQDILEVLDVLGEGTVLPACTIGEAGVVGAEEYRLRTSAGVSG